MPPHSPFTDVVKPEGIPVAIDAGAVPVAMLDGAAVTKVVIVAELMTDAAAEDDATGLAATEEPADPDPEDPPDDARPPIPLTG